MGMGCGHAWGHRTAGGVNVRGGPLTRRFRVGGWRTVCVTLLMGGRALIPSCGRDVILPRADGYSRGI